MKNVAENLIKSERFSLTGKKLKVAEALANPEAGQTDKDIYTAVGISHDTFYRWLREDKEILEYAAHLIDRYTDKELGAVWRALIKECKAGNVPAIKLYFELKGKYSQNVKVEGLSDIIIVDDINGGGEDGKS